MGWHLSVTVASVLVISILAIVVSTETNVNYPTTYLEKSIPYIGATPTVGGLDGDGIVVAVIDTGIDYTHPDLSGFGPDAKVIGGFNFIDPSQPPLDTNGHGTQVAGIIAADGTISGIAPATKLLAYKVSEDGEGVRPDLIINSLKMAVEDGADIINISLGVNKTNSSIDEAVAEASRRGAIVVVAAGNDGERESIGSPGRNPSAITVGATYNNLTSSKAAILHVNNASYAAIPMVGSAVPAEPIRSNIVYAGYAKESDFVGLDVSGAIVLAERGSDTPGELLYFSLKEKNAADAGAAAIMVFNNQEGIFYGELLHNFTEPGYMPRIPTVSIDREDGLEMLEELPDAHAMMLFLHNPDHRAPFSSQGPAPPFIKPDIMAPGVHINTTTISGEYAISTGTSYATPHVSGAVALLLQQYPFLTTEEVRSILTTTSSIVNNKEGSWEDLFGAGSGRLDVQAALATDLIIEPSVLTANISPLRPHDNMPVHIKTISGSTPEDIAVQFEPKDGDASHTVTDSNVIMVNIGPEQYTDSRMLITHNNITHTVPIKVYHSNGTIHATQDSGKLHLEVFHVEDWDFAKISVSNRNGDVSTESVMPGDIASVNVHENGTFHIRADISIGRQSDVAYDSIIVDTATINDSVWLGIHVPWRQLLAAFVFSAAIAIVAVFIPKVRRF